MASINSHRKRQVYSYSLWRQTRHNRIGDVASSGSVAAPMMPDKKTTGDPWYVNRREFANIDVKLGAMFLGGAMKRTVSQTPGSLTLTYHDKLITHPAGMPALSEMQYIPAYLLTAAYAAGAKRPVLAYSTDINSAYSLLNYTRSRTGLVVNGHTSYKSVRVKVSSGSGGPALSTTSYQEVIPVGQYIGGNIKSRQTALKWLAGMWREK